MRLCRLVVVVVSLLIPARAFSQTALIPCPAPTPGAPVSGQAAIDAAAGCVGWLARPEGTD